MDGMDTDQSEAFISTGLEQEKVVELAKKFDKDDIMKEMQDCLKHRKEREEERRQNRTVADLNMRLFHDDRPDVTDYYTSYDDHIKKIGDEIEDQKALIIDGLKRLQLLIEKEALLKEEYDVVTSETFQLPKYLRVDEFFDPLIKEHIFKKHPQLIGDYFGEYRYSSHAGHLNMERVYDKNGKIVKVRCMKCYINYIKNCNDSFAPSKDDGEIDTHDHFGGQA